MRIELFAKEKLLAGSSKYMLCYKRGLLVLRTVDKQIVKKCRIHPFYKSFTLLERLMRIEPRAAVSLNDDCFLYSCCGSVYQYDVYVNTINKIHCFDKGMNNPLSFCTRKDDEGNVIEVIYGEYIWNHDKGPVSIFRYNMKTWEKVYSFPAGTVGHIHNVFFDEYKMRYIILTGDADSDSAIWEADLYFENVRKIVGGNQKYRACIACPTKDGIIYATDTPLEQNKLFFLDDRMNLHEIYEMPGPCIFGRFLDGCLYMATSVEGNPQLGRWKYRLSNALGKGVKDRNVHIIRCDMDYKVEEVAKFKKDFFPMWLFQFGNAQFPNVEKGLYVSTQSTVESGTYKIL